MRTVLSGSQSPENWEGRSLPEMIQRIELPASLQQAIRQFYDVRSRLVHGRDVDESDVIRTLDSGLKILSALRDLDYEVHEVQFPAVSVYSDPDEKHQREINAVVLHTYSKSRSRRDVFPTRQTYITGQRLTWEWDTSRSWPESWYRDPDTDALEAAWTSTTEFAGRPLDAVV